MKQCAELYAFSVSFSRRKANSDMRWKVAWKDVEILKSFGSVISGCNKSKLTMEDTEVNSHLDAFNPFPHNDTF